MKEFRGNIIVQIFFNDNLLQATTMSFLVSCQTILGHDFLLHEKIQL